MHFTQIVELIIGSYFIAAITWSYSLLISAHRQLKREDRPKLTSWPSVTVLIPAYNEELCIVSAVEQVLYMNYPGELTVSICDDGSTDNTLSLIQSHFGNNSRVSVVSQPNGGRAAAVNGALAKATGKYVVATDADTIIDTTSFQKIIYKMETDPTLEAVGGSILLSNNVERRLSHLPVIGRAPTGFLAGTQAVEYIRAFLYGRLGLNKLGGNVIISGAFGVFRRETVLRLGGWDKNTVAEDFEMTVKIRHAGGKVLFIPDPTAWTEVPNDLRSLSSQRERWHRGLSQIMWRWGKKVMFRPSQKSLGMVTMPTYFVFEWLAPFIELAGYLLIISHAISGNLSLTSAMVLSIAYVMWVLLSIMSIRMEQKHFNRYRGSHDTARLVFFALVEPLWYRPLTVYWRLKGWIRSMTGTNSWGKMKRRGFVALIGLMVLPTILSAQTVSGYARMESGTNVPARTDIYVSSLYNTTSVDLHAATRLGFTDIAFGASTLNAIGNTFLVGGAVAISPNATLLPEYSIGASAGFRSNPIVNVTTVTFKSFTTQDVWSASNTTDYYTGRWIVSPSFGMTNVSETWYIKLSTAYTVNQWTVTAYGITGNELLDFPQFVAPVSEVGTIVKHQIGNGWITAGMGYGTRDGEWYVAPVIGGGIKF